MYRDAKSRKPTIYKEGDYVFLGVRDTRAKPGVNSKLKPNYKGPYIVKKILGNNRYVIADIPGFNLTPCRFYRQTNSNTGLNL